MAVTAQLPPVTLETLDGHPVMRWMDMQAWAENFEGMMWVHLLIDAYVGSYGHYFAMNGDITMFLDPALWEKFQISMAEQSSPALVPMDECSINGVIIKPYMPPAMVKGEDKFLGVMLIKQDGTTQVITDGRIVDIEDKDEEYVLKWLRAILDSIPVKNDSVDPNEGVLIATVVRNPDGSVSIKRYEDNAKMLPWNRDA